MTQETKTISLAREIKGDDGKPLKAVIIREPTFDEYMIHGDPYTVAASAGGTPFAVENPEVIRKYFDLCLVQPKNSDLLSQLKARDAKQIKEVLLGFFQPAGETASEASTTSQTNLSSGDTAASTQQASKS